MKDISILNDVLGPVMRGPSSSHTAAAYHLAVLARALLGCRPARAEIAFDAEGSYGRVYRQQGADLAFAAGLLGWPITDPQFSQALELAPQCGLRLEIATRSIPGAEHPNEVLMHLVGPSGRRLDLAGRSIGGGAVELTALDGWPVLLTGSSWELLVKVEAAAEGWVKDELLRDGEVLGEVAREVRDDRVLLAVRRRWPLADAAAERLRRHDGVLDVWRGRPLMHVQTGRAPLHSAAEMVALAEAQGLSAAGVALHYEAELLGLPETAIVEEMAGRLDVMAAAVADGLEADVPPMQLLGPTAGRIFRAEAQRRVAIGGLHTRAAARAMAAMHVNCGMGVVCAAPTAGSAGVLPGLVVTLQEELGLSREAAARCLLAAGLIGAVVARRATFAAEVAGCQVEIGAAGAMAAAAVVEAVGGTARQACDAAAVCFQNTMGLVCDLVQGIVEIPCHTRNAAAASSAMVVADLILGGYENPVPLDETIDAVFAVGKMLPAELRVTALGGLAAAPSARALKRRR